jgi:hypothetical protein
MLKQAYKVVGANYKDTNNIADARIRYYKLQCHRK